MSATPAAPVIRMPAGDASGDARELLSVLGDLQGLLQQLVDTAERKLQAMREGQPTELTDCTRRELDLLQAVHKAEQRRNATLARLAQGLQCPELRTGTLSMTAEVLPEPQRSQLRARIAGLRQTASDLRQKNQLASEVARRLQVHLRSVFSELARTQQENVVYGPKGQQWTGGGSRLIVDAMG